MYSLLPTNAVGGRFGSTATDPFVILRGLITLLRGIGH